MIFKWKKRISVEVVALACMFHPVGVVFNGIRQDYSNVTWV